MFCACAVAAAAAAAASGSLVDKHARLDKFYDPFTGFLGDLIAFLPSLIMLFATYVAHRSHLPLGGHTCNAGSAGRLQLLVLLLLPFWLTCVRSNKIGHEPFHGQLKAYLTNILS